MAGDAGEHLRSFPGVHMTGQRAPALQAAGGNVDPIQGVFLRHPHRAFTYRVARIDNQFGFHGNSFPWLWGDQDDQSPNGPAAQKAPPW
ncbi:hypothetical protein D3C75_1114000 [compost metagenome]